ncbi:hypothetical protein D3C75_795300 [compost metagenome]
MPIILSQTYEIVTEESAQEGDAAERGYDWQDEPYSLRDTVELIKSEGFNYPSDSSGVPRWLSTVGILDYESGDYETKFLHPGSDARSQRYWEKAVRAADILKDAEYWRGVIKGIHANGLRALVTYKATDGYRAKGLAINDAMKGVGPGGVWFVWVDNFANCVRLTDIIDIRPVER